MKTDRDLIIIGGGSAGLVAASVAAQLKAKVTLIEKEKLGGDCLWYGCVPSKSLIHAARIAYQVKHSARFGIYTTHPEIKFAEATGYVKNVIAAIEPHDSPERFRGLGVEVIFGSASFISPQAIEVNGQQLTARAFIIATGSRPAIPPIPGLQEAGYITNEQAFSLQQCPASLIVLGAGPIGCELGQAYHRLGTKVTMIVSRNQILPKEDPEAARVIEQQFTSEGLRIIKQARGEKVEINKGEKSLWVGGEKITATEILVSTGRTPNVENLNLEVAGVVYNSKGVKVNNQLQTTNPKIYACGDVIGGYQFTHVASYEAVIALTNALFAPITRLFPKTIDYRTIPWATFTEPELARVGLTETEARAQYGDKIYVLTQPFAGVDRAQAEGETAGFAKIITLPNGQILGAHLVGMNAGDLIHEIVLAMNNKLPVSKLTGIHIYPTLSEVNSKAALLLSKQKYAQNSRLQKGLETFFQVLRSF